VEIVPKRINRKFNEEFKQQAVELAKSVGTAQAAKDLGVHQTQINYWRSKLASNGQPIGKKSYEELESENKKLNKELHYMREINKVLKKSTAIFSQELMGDLK